MTEVNVTLEFDGTPDEPTCTVDAGYQLSHSSWKMQNGGIDMGAMGGPVTINFRIQKKHENSDRRDIHFWDHDNSIASTSWNGTSGPTGNPHIPGGKHLKFKHVYNGVLSATYGNKKNLEYSVSYYINGQLQALDPGIKYGGSMLHKLVATILAFLAGFLLWRRFRR